MFAFSLYLQFGDKRRESQSCEIRQFPATETRLNRVESTNSSLRSRSRRASPVRGCCCCDDHQFVLLFCFGFRTAIASFAAENVIVIVATVVASPACNVDDDDNNTPPRPPPSDTATPCDWSRTATIFRPRYTAYVSNIHTHPEKYLNWSIEAPSSAPAQRELNLSSTSLGSIRLENYKRHPSGKILINFYFKKFWRP